MNIANGAAWGALTGAAAAVVVALSTGTVMSLATIATQGTAGVFDGSFSIAAFTIIAGFVGSIIGGLAGCIIGAVLTVTDTVHWAPWTGALLTPVLPISVAASFQTPTASIVPMLMVAAGFVVFAGLIGWFAGTRFERAMTPPIPTGF